MSLDPSGIEKFLDGLQADLACVKPHTLNGNGRLGEWIDPVTEQKPIKWLDMSGWDDAQIPERKWAIRDRVPLNQAGLFSGEGGTGKSIRSLS